MHFNARHDVKSWQSHSSKISRLGQGHRVIYVLEEYVEDSYYARLDTCRYHCFTETHFNARLNIKSWQSHSSMISRSRAKEHCVCLKSMSRTITMQGLTLAAITASRQHTLMLRLDVKSWQSQSSGKSRSRAMDNSVCLKKMLRKITMQGMTLTAITASEKRTLMLDSM